MTTKVAIIQARPAYYNLAASVDKALALIKEAADNGARLVTLGETWLPGYPVWLDVCPNMGLWDHAPTKEVYYRLHQNSVTVPGPEVAQFCELARQRNIVIVLSVNERVDKAPGHGTLYNTLLTINERGEVANHHRKLMPTYTERIVWGHGDGAGLNSVDTVAGRVGGLICWEHWMPLARQAMHDTGEQIHVAVYPTVNDYRHQTASRHYAFEGRCFVLAAGSIVRASDLPTELALRSDIKPDDLVQRGGSAIIAPDGRYLAEPVFDTEAMLYADLDLSETVKELMSLDVTGHYSRPDVFGFEVRRDRRS
ncbi:MAG: carbon-nitrogen hydrolase family protein [Chloroflexota bacterium]